VLNRGVLEGKPENSDPVEEEPRVLIGQAKRNPLPLDDPFDRGRFEPVPVEAVEEVVTEYQARRRRFDRLLQPLIVRRWHAIKFLARRKIARLHRRFPIWQVAAFYLALVGGICVLLAAPLLRPVQREGVPLAPRPVVPSTLEEELSRIAEWIGAKKTDEALGALDRLEQSVGTDSRISMARGAALAAARDYPRAYEAFSQAVVLTPNSLSARLNLAEIEFVMGKYAEAGERYEDLLRQQPRNPLLVFRAYLCARQQKLEAKAAALRDNPVVGSHSLEWYYIQAAEAFGAGKTAEAGKLVDQARLLFGDKARPYDLTFQRLGFLKDIPAEK
jgi:tetratricopeptide (TPR) repeat protein